MDARGLTLRLGGNKVAGDVEVTSNWLVDALYIR